MKIHFPRRFRPPLYRVAHSLSAVVEHLRHASRVALHEPQVGRYFLQHTA
jgi:hypothetical protein